MLLLLQFLKNAFCFCKIVFILYIFQYSHTSLFCALCISIYLWMGFSLSPALHLSPFFFYLLLHWLSTTKMSAFLSSTLKAPHFLIYCPSILSYYYHFYCTYSGWKQLLILPWNMFWNWKKKASSQANQTSEIM